MEQPVAAIIVSLMGILSGAAGYWIVTFWMQPIIRYKNIRTQIHWQFIYYAQVVNSDGMGEVLQNFYRERIFANRRSAAELSAICLELPRWYIWILEQRKVNPFNAAKHLIGYSNTTEYELSCRLQGNILKNLGLPEEV